MEKPQIQTSVPELSDALLRTRMGLADFLCHLEGSLIGADAWKDKESIEVAISAGSLAHFHRYDIANAMKYLAAESAQDLAGRLVPRLKAHLEENCPRIIEKENGKGKHQAALERKHEEELTRVRTQLERKYQELDAEREREWKQQDELRLKREEQLTEKARTLELRLRLRLNEELVQKQKQQGDRARLQKEHGLERQGQEEIYRQLQQSISGMISNKLSAVYSESDERVQLVARETRRKGLQVASQLKIEASMITRLSQLALYDFMIVCDNRDLTKTPGDVLGTSLKETVRRFFTIATALNPEGGITLRFFGNERGMAGEPKKLKSKLEVDRVLKAQRVQPYTHFFPNLQNGILNGLEDKAKKGELTNCTMVVMIISGEALPATAEGLGNVISKFKTFLTARHYPSTVVLFFICHLGADPVTQSFLELISCNEDIKDILCCCKEDLAAKHKEAGGDHGLHAGQLVQILSKTLDLQLD